MCRSGLTSQFKSCHGIRELDLQGEKLSESKGETAKFVVHLVNYIEKNGYREDSIDNADKSRITRNVLLQKTFEIKDEQSAAEHKVGKVE